MQSLLDLLRQEKDLANAVAAIASAATALVAVVVSLWALHVQRRHNILSIRPIPEVTVADYEGSLRVKLRNNGTGPMLVTSLQVFGKDGVKPSIIEWMPSLPGGRMWNHFSMALENRTFQPDGAIPLLELTSEQLEPTFAHCRDLTRAELRNLRVVVHYTDIYRSRLPTYEKSLAWFGRNINGA
jgi:hypothetical protein